MNDCGGISICKSSQVQQPYKAQNNPWTVPVVSTQVADVNSDRAELIMQNVGTTVLYVGLGFPPSLTNYSFALSAGGAANDGTGGFFSSLVWKGSVFVISASAGGLLAITEEV